MPQVQIIACPKCTRLLLAKTGQKTRTCPYCGNQVNACTARRIAVAENAKEASQLLQKLKTDQALKKCS